MKPVSIKIYLVEILLIVLATSFAFLSIGVPANDIAFWSASWGDIVNGEARIPIVLGVIPFANLALFLCFAFLYLLFEFYGFKTAVYTSLAISIVLLLQFYLFFGLQKLNPVGIDNQVLLATVPLSNLNQNLVHAVAAAVTLGFTAIFAVAWTIKKLTRDYFMFIRFFFGSVLGFVVFVFVKTYVQRRHELGLVSVVMESITPSLQFAALTIFSILPLYLLRLFLGLFRGRGIVNYDNYGSGQPLFKARTATPAPASAAEAPAIIPSDSSDREEITNDANPA